MGIRIPDNSGPFRKAEAAGIFLLALALTTLTFVVPFPFALLAGIPAYFCWWVLLGNLFV